MSSAFRISSVSMLQENSLESLPSEAWNVSKADEYFVNFRHLFQQNTTLKHL
jgi:hypothetical protein